MEFFPGTQERVQNSRGKGAIGVRAIEVLLYVENINMKTSRWGEHYYGKQMLPWRIHLPFSS